MLADCGLYGHSCGAESDVSLLLCQHRYCLGAQPAPRMLSYSYFHATDSTGRIHLFVYPLPYLIQYCYLRRAKVVVIVA